MTNFAFLGLADELKIRINSVKRMNMLSTHKDQTWSWNFGRKSWVRNSLAFTLIELLVVIAIIGILAVLSFLAISRSKARAQ